MHNVDIRDWFKWDNSLDKQQIKDLKGLAKEHHIKINFNLLTHCDDALGNQKLIEKNRNDLWKFYRKLNKKLRRN